MVRECDHLTREVFGGEDIRHDGRRNLTKEVWKHRERDIGTLFTLRRDFSAELHQTW